MIASELRIKHIATLQSASLLRNALRAFLNVLELNPTGRDDIVTAAGEAVANALEHAYTGQALGMVELHVRENGPDGLSVMVGDNGRFLVRDKTPGRGVGLQIVHAIARSVSIETKNGTRVHMRFDAPHRASSECVS